MRWYEYCQYQSRRWSERIYTLSIVLRSHLVVAPKTKAASAPARIHDGDGSDDQAAGRGAATKWQTPRQRCACSA